MGGLSFIGAALLVKLPETKDRQTLETINQLLEVDRKRKTDLLVMENGATNEKHVA